MLLNLGSELEYSNDGFSVKNDLVVETLIG